MTDPADTSAPDKLVKARRKQANGANRAGISEKTITQIRNEIDRTGTGPMRLLHGARDKPVGLSVHVIDSWLYGNVRSAFPVHVVYVLNRWAALPTNKFITITAKIRATLQAEFIRTGMSATAVLKDADDIPPGLTPQVIMAWLNQTTRKVRDRHWKYVIARLRALPDLSPSSSHRVRRSAQQEIGASDLAELRHHRERTGVGGMVLLKSAADKPEGLTASMISGWLNGVTKAADPEYVAYVLGRYRVWP